MQKINVASVIKAHLETLSQGNRLVRDDFLLFYLAPFLCGISFVIFKAEVPEKALELSISVFSIFAALLLSVQVAMYGVALRGVTPPDDAKKIKHFEELKANRDLLLKQLNSNISYLILLSVITVTVTLVLFFLKPPRVYGSALVVFFYIHFFLTLLMVIKRSSIVFSREYDQRI